jgi:PAS domain S-box-containing protein
VLTSYHWNPYAAPWAVVGVALLTLAGVIFHRQRASRVAILFCVMIVLVGVWFAGFTGMLSANGPRFAEIWARIALGTVALLPAAIYDFTATALRLHSNRMLVIRLTWLIAIVFSGVGYFTGGIVASVAPHPWGWYPVAGRIAPLFLLFFFVALLGQTADGIAEYRRTTDRGRRRRVGRLMLSFIVVYAAMVDFIPMFGVSRPPIGYVPVVAFLVIAWGTIRQHRLQTITAARAARQILETMADALFVIDAEGKVRVVNDAGRSMLGCSDNDLLGRNIDSLEWHDHDATISRTLGELSRRGPIRDQERTFRNSDGERIDVSVSISPVSEGDEQRGAVIIARDIRERKRAEADLHMAMDRMRQSNRELEDFAYVASHDLQEPLRKIQAFGDLLESKHKAVLPPQAVDYIDRMRAAARRMQVLISDLLMFSRITTKAQPFVPVDLASIAHDVVRDLEVRTHESGGHIEIGPLPTIDADPLQMRQLLQNLVGNALKFHRPGVPPLVQIDARIDATVEHGTCSISVADNGIGFDEKYADRIFTMFERLHGRGTYEGTGIGLAICRRIAERHGGTIVAHSTPGEGSTFVVTLPVRQPQEGESSHGSSRESDRDPPRG